MTKEVRSRRGGDDGGLGEQGGWDSWVQLYRRDGQRFRIVNDDGVFLIFDVDNVGMLIFLMTVDSIVDIPLDISFNQGVSFTLSSFRRL